MCRQRPCTVYPSPCCGKGEGFNEVYRNCVQFHSAIAMSERIARTHVVTRSMGADVRLHELCQDHGHKWTMR